MQTNKINTVTVLSSFGELVALRKGFTVEDKDGFGVFLSKLDFTDKFKEELAVRICGSAAGPHFEALVGELGLMLTHLSMISINVAEETVMFATCTHSSNIKGEYISGFTQSVALQDFKLDDKIQYVSGTTLKLPLALFIDALNKQVIYLIDIQPELKVAEWLKDKTAETALKNAAQLNWIAQSMIETQNTILKEAGIESIQLELPKTYMTRFDGKSGIFKINQYTTINLMKGFKTTAKFMSKI